MPAVLYRVAPNFAHRRELQSIPYLVLLRKKTGSRYLILVICKFQFWQFWALSTNHHKRQYIVQAM